MYPYAFLYIFYLAYLWYHYHPATLELTRLVKTKQTIKLSRIVRNLNCTVDGLEGKKIVLNMWKFGMCTDWSFNHMQVPTDWIFKTSIPQCFKIGDETKFVRLAHIYSMYCRYGSNTVGTFPKYDIVHIYLSNSNIS